MPLEQSIKKPDCYKCHKLFMNKNDEECQNCEKRIAYTKYLDSQDPFFRLTYDTKGTKDE
jgi:hypothetical protein